MERLKTRDVFFKSEINEICFFTHQRKGNNSNLDLKKVNLDALRDSDDSASNLELPS